MTGGEIRLPACLSGIDLIPNKVAVLDRIWTMSKQIAKQPEAQWKKMKSSLLHI